MQQIQAEDVLRIVRQYGPIVPNKIKQTLNQSDSTLVSVYLSDLVREGKVRMTHVKLGASTFAYTPEQVPKLAELIKHHNEKDRRAAEKLRSEKVIRASTQEPLMRVALGQIKDFAKPVTVKTSKGEELFYRWYLTPSDEVQRRIKSLLGVKQPDEKVVEKPKEEPQKKTQEVTTPKQEEKATIATQKVKQEEKPVKQETPKTKEEQAVLTEVEPESDFAKEIVAYCEKNGITIIELEEIRKESELDLKIQMPTPVGKILYYAKAKSKKNSNDGDLASAILSAKRHMLPAIYFTTGSVTKKAKENKDLQEITVVEIGS